MQLFVAFIFLFGGVVGVFVFQHIEKFLLFPPSKAFQTNSSLLLKKKYSKLWISTFDWISLYPQAHRL